MPLSYGPVVRVVLVLPVLLVVPVPRVVRAAAVGRGTAGLRAATAVHAAAVRCACWLRCAGRPGVVAVAAGAPAAECRRGGCRARWLTCLAGPPGPVTFRRPCRVRRPCRLRRPRRGGVAEVAGPAGVPAYGENQRTETRRAEPRAAGTRRKTSRPRAAPSLTPRGRGGPCGTETALTARSLAEWDEAMWSLAAIGDYSSWLCGGSAAMKGWSRSMRPSFDAPPGEPSSSKNSTFAL